RDRDADLPGVAAAPEVDADEDLEVGQRLAARRRAGEVKREGPSGWGNGAGIRAGRRVDRGDRRGGGGGVGGRLGRGLVRRGNGRGVGGRGVEGVDRVALAREDGRGGGRGARGRIGRDGRPLLPGAAVGRDVDGERGDARGRAAVGAVRVGAGDLDREAEAG